MKRRFTLRMHDYIHWPKGKLKYNEQLFTEIAPRYDFITRALSLGADAEWKDELVAKLPYISSPKCLDLACGTGDITFRLANKYPAGLVVGLDLTEDMIALARFHNVYNNIHFTVKDMCQTGFDDNSFDIVTGGYALRNAPDIKKALNEIWRVMKFGGKAAFLDFSKPSSRFFQKLENALLKTWGSFWGLTLHGNTEVYTYIAESLKQFPNHEQLKQYLREVGFVNIQSKKHLFGITETIVFEKVTG
ncbi:MAG: ubiquinone/menaquinone biosynthesis methyltransferase [Phycisphaerae bacterium]